MSNENNKMQVDIDNLIKQNVNDLSAIKELYSKLEELGEKITQIKYIDNTLVKKLKKEYENLKKVILDENVQVELNNKIEETKTELNNKIEETKTELNEVSSQLENIETKKANLNEVRLKSVPNTLNDCDEEMLQAIQGGEGTSFNLLSVPRDNSVADSKLSTHILNNLGNYEDIDLSLKTGLVNKNTGEVNTSFTQWNYDIIECSYGERYIATVEVAGDITAMIVMFNGDNVMQTINDGISNDDRVYENYEFLIPEGCTSFALTGLKKTKIELKKYKMMNVRDDVLKLNENTKNIGVISNNLTDYLEVDGTVENGIYSESTGILNVNFPQWNSIKISCTPNEVLRVTSLVEGGLNALAIYYDKNGDYMKSYLTGTNGVQTEYIDEEVIVPKDAYFIAVSGKATHKLSIKRKGIINVVEEIKALKNETPTNYWTGKKIVWFGTSIPETGGYPQLLGEYLGTNVINEAVGSSMVRSGHAGTNDDPRGWKGLDWSNCAYSLTQSLADKQYLIDNWDTLKSDFVGHPENVNVSGSAWYQNKIKSCSYEKKLVEKHLGDNRADLFVFDHGHNDYLFYIDQYKDDLTQIPSNAKDTKTYIGAMNFLIDLILKDNPHAKIVFIGHYENDRKPKITQAQEILAKRWNFPLLKVWEKIGWTQNKVSTTGYWQDKYTWIENGGVEREIPLTQIWLQDDLHPYSDKAKNRYLDVLIPFFETLR